jgi:hypothetical protein
MRPISLPLALILAGLCGAQDLTDETFARWQSYLAPKAGEEEWRDIPWLPTFAEAVEASRSEGKPILLWAMNGHPLGCT